MQRQSSAGNLPAVARAACPRVHRLVTCAGGTSARRPPGRRRYNDNHELWDGILDLPNVLPLISHATVFGKPLINTKNSFRRKENGYW